MLGRRRFLVSACVVIGLAAPLWSPVASAQSVFGTHRWQMMPYCNMLTLTLSPSQDGARVEGFDDLCGAANRASAIGMASLNASGGVTINLTIVTSPDAVPVHVTAVVSMQSGFGNWLDNTGQSGSLIYNGANPGLPARPITSPGLAPNVVTTRELAPGAVQAADINAAEVQSRVNGTCPLGEAMTGVWESGAVRCVPLAQIQPNSITTTEIAPGAVTGSDILASEVQARVTGACPAGQAMTGVNADGTVACTPITGGGGTSVAFKAGGHPGGNYLPISTYTDVTWTSTRFSSGGGTFDGTSYVAPASGLYLLTALVSVEGQQTSGLFCGALRVNGTNVGLTCDYYTANANIGTPGISISTTAQLAQGDSVRVSLLPFTNIRIGGGHVNETNFSVTRLQ